MNKSVENIFDRVKPLEEVRWGAIEMIMDAYAEKYPEELAGCFEYVRQLKDGTNDAFATSGAQRHAYEVPARLHKALSVQFPRLFEGENLRKFLSMYPNFQVADKI